MATALSVLPHDLGAALQLYERSRLPGTTRVVLGARGFGDQTPSGWSALKRNVLIALRSRFGFDRTGRGFACLYDYDAGSTAALVQTDANGSTGCDDLSSDVVVMAGGTA